jgi:hypothetical protein
MTRDDDILSRCCACPGEAVRPVRLSVDDFAIPDEAERTEAEIHLTVARAHRDSKAGTQLARDVRKLRHWAEASRDFARLVRDYVPPDGAAEHRSVLPDFPLRTVADQIVRPAAENVVSFNEKRILGLAVRRGGMEMAVGVSWFYQVFVRLLARWAWRDVLRWHLESKVPGVAHCRLDDRFESGILARDFTLAHEARERLRALGYFVAVARRRRPPSGPGARGRRR